MGFVPVAEAAPGAVALVGVPLDRYSSFRRGAAGGPSRIREALLSPASNLWSECGRDLSLPGLVADAGDVAVEQAADPLQSVEDAISALLGRGLRPLILGGDHTLTWPAVRAVSRFHPCLEILHFDAHPDLYDEFDGQRRSHACPFARIMEEGCATRLLQVGVRAMTGHQREQARRFGVEVLEMRDFRDAPLFRGQGPVYVSLDLDALDPAHAPGVSHPEPGGLSTRQILGVIQHLRRDVVAADVVELNPLLDRDGITARVAAKLVKELAARMHDRPGPG